ncbi:serine/threonine-protein kinase 17A isoform X1 [Salmo salar]|uniref:non-specific serine/threonine protein kinase n=1 Tax=Salmo salar TaxID=8030 RepID=B5X1X8_SALSA|nr:serine/threonine-protein kinase 17A isoform X1 [Salmo salar]ACI33309.1 Serine/threonine-protein kinase 17A [Salmo salar]|eukprot:XP_014045922.1 PREDICTED: serine/threonine-protein kinase 17A-like isoform X1 [Salmo salar]
MIPPPSPRVTDTRSCTRCRGQTETNPGATALLLDNIKTPIRTESFKELYNVIPGKELGRGKFAIVKRCMEKSTGTEYAAKFLKKRRKGQDCRVEVLHEIAVLELTNTSHRIINLHQVYETLTEMVLVLEYAAGGEVFNQCVAERDEAFSQEEVKWLMRQILEGVAFLHRNNIVHLDLKPQNILLTSACPLGDIKIVDFGLSRRLCQNQELREIMGTPEYVAPEILNYEPISTATDMWSIGVLAYMMLTGTSPFLGEDKQETFLNISQINIDYTENGLQDLSAIHFIQSLLIKEPKSRATAEECLRHHWLQEQAQKKTEDNITSEICQWEHAKPAPPSLSSEEEGPVVEELMVVSAYTTGPCRPTVPNPETLFPDAKAISKRFTFEEPRCSLQKTIF